MKNEKKIYVCQELRMKAIGVKSDNGDGHYIIYELIIKYVFFFFILHQYFSLNTPLIPSIFYQT